MARDKKKIIKHVYHEVSDWAFDLMQEHTVPKPASKIKYICPKEIKRLFPDNRPGKDPEGSPRPMWRNPCHFQIKFKGDWVVCHGFSGGTWGGSCAWIEKDGYAIDLSRVTDPEYFSVIVGQAPAKKCQEFIEENRIPVKQFYRRHRISDVQKYSRLEARTLMDAYQTYGPWKGEPKRWG